MYCLFICGSFIVLKVVNLRLHKSLGTDPEPEPEPEKEEVEEEEDREREGEKQSDEEKSTLGTVDRGKESVAWELVAAA